MHHMLLCRNDVFLKQSFQFSEGPKIALSQHMLYLVNEGVDENVAKWAVSFKLYKSDQK